MSPLWVWVENLEGAGHVTLTPDEARHVVSRRLRTGDDLVVFDGKGRTASARVEELTRKSTRIEVGPVEQATPPVLRFGLATAIPKGDRLSTLLQMGTQLGLTVWQPLVLEDSAVRKIDVEAPRIQRILLEGCKVARRPWKMELRAPLDLREAIARCDASMPLFYGDQEGDQKGGREGGDARAIESSGWVFIGPEAGFSRPEFATLREAGAVAVAFGPHNLRIETAAAAAMASFNRSSPPTQGAGA